MRSYSDHFHETLAALTSAHGVPEQQADAVRALWARIAPLEPSEPHVILTDAGTAMFEWNNDVAAASVEVHPDGRFEWWALDRATDAADGTGDDPVAELPAAFWSLLPRLAFEAK